MTASEITEFLRESNAIEGVYDEDSLKQAEYAWAYLMTQDAMMPGVVLKTHKILMLNQPLYPNEKGYLRTIPVWIGMRQLLKADLVPQALETWCYGMNVQGLADMDWQSRKLHVNYEQIHPFVDGNGRTGRMFMNWFRLRNELPLLTITEAEKEKYYGWFK